MGEVVQFRDYGREPERTPASKIMAGLEQALLHAKGYDVGAKVHVFGPDDLTQGHADPEMLSDSGDCA